MRRKKPARLHKKQEKKPLLKENNMIFGIPLEFLLIAIIMICMFILILMFMGPCTESGRVYNNPLAFYVIKGLL